MVRHSAGVPLAGGRFGMRWLTLATLAVAAAGALASSPVAANAMVLHPAAPGAVSGNGAGGAGSGTGVGTGSATNTSGGSPAQQAAITVNGLASFQAAVCNQRMQTCNVNQRLWVQW
ncbi:hypothetical protein ACFHYQ_27050 [Sphaerimonospora cavernae]|uniref:Uncharacterized protein n=1 Tax=Sphaerimonospora cavernae TaxID=1740611 RepID=A0ABV6UCQ3_9ACTN